MRSLNPWTFALLFIGFFLYLIWNNLELPKLFIDGSIQKEATILKVEDWRSMTGRGFVQKAKIAFTNGDSICYQNARMDPKKNRMYVGAILNIEHSITDPTNFRVIDYPYEERYYPKKFYEYIDGFRQELSFCNGILEKKIFKLDESLISEEYFAYSLKGDSIQVFKLFDQERNPNNCYFFESREENRMLIRELTTNELFKQQNVNFKRR